MYMFGWVEGAAILPNKVHIRKVVLNVLIGTIIQFVFDC